MEFEWPTVAGNRSNHLTVSPSGTSSNLIVDRKVGRSRTEMPGLDEGVYYWVVTSIDAHGNESQASTPNRFDPIQQVSEDHRAFLEVTNIIQHGRIMESDGRKEPMVIINKQQVVNIAADGTFRAFYLASQKGLRPDHHHGAGTERQYQNYSQDSGARVAKK